MRATGQAEVVLTAEDAGNFDIGTIWLSPIARSGSNFVSITSLSAPKDAKKFLETGRALARRNKIPEAMASVEKAIAAYPRYAEAWVVLGALQFETLQDDAARTSMDKATGIDSRLVTPLQVLGYIAAQQRQWNDSARYLDEAVRLDPTNSALAWFYDGWAHYELGDLDVAERSAKASLGMDPRAAGSQSEYLLGLVLIARMDFAGGEQALRNFVASSTDTQRIRSANEILQRMDRPIMDRPIMDQPTMDQPTAVAQATLR
jgi:tetratricopeptide (TPR) repeat protein